MYSNSRNDKDPRYQDWRKAVLRRDRYRCQICGRSDRMLHSHHKDSWNWAINRRYDIDNGVTLCGGRGGCHTLFHHIYGRGNNSAGQYANFYLQYHGRQTNYDPKSRRKVTSKRVKKKLLDIQKDFNEQKDK